MTDMNADVDDVAYGYQGCAAGVHAALERQGLLAGRRCLDPAEDVSPGQLAEIDRVCRAHPGLTDDASAAAKRDRWLA